MKIILLLLAILASLAVLVSSTEDEETIYELVFYDEGSSPEKTEKLLEELDTIYSNTPKGSTDGKKEKVQQLLELSRMNRDECNQEYYETIKSYRKTYSRWSGNLVDYLDSQKLKEQEACIGKFKVNFHKAIDDIPTEMRKDLEAMSEKIDIVDEDLSNLIENLTMYDDFSWKFLNTLNLFYKGNFKEVTKKPKHKSISAGVLDYLVTKEDKLMELLKSERASGKRLRLEFLLETHVRPMCQKIGDILTPFKYIYDCRLDLFKDIAEVKQYFKYKVHCEAALYNPQVIVHTMAEIAGITKLGRTVRVWYELAKDKKNKFF